LKFFERARTEWLRSLGIGQHVLREQTGGMFVVSETTVQYHRPAVLDDHLQVTAGVLQAVPCEPAYRAIGLARRTRPSYAVVRRPHSHWLGGCRHPQACENTCINIGSSLMNQDLSIVHLLLNASWVVQLVVLLLLGVSVVSWAAIFRKVLALKRVNQLNDEFERDFWSGKSLNELFSAATQNAKLAGPMERIFASGMREYQKLR